MPVVNGLCDRYHPCQILADLLTLKECWGDWRGRRLAWVGDGNNVCHSWMVAAALTGFRLRIATPAGFEPDADLFARCNEVARVSGLVVGSAGYGRGRRVDHDVWVSMGQEAEAEEKRRLFMPYQVNAQRWRMPRSMRYCSIVCRASGRRGHRRVDRWSPVGGMAEAEKRLHAQCGLWSIYFLQGEKLQT